MINDWMSDSFVEEGSMISIISNYNTSISVVSLLVYEMVAVI